MSQITPLSPGRHQLRLSARLWVGKGLKFVLSGGGRDRKIFGLEKAALGKWDLEGSFWDQTLAQLQKDVGKWAAVEA